MQAIENHSQKSTKRSEGHNVKKVIDFRLDNGKRYYKVKWETSWELEDNLQEYQNVLNEFWSFVDRVKVDREEPPQRKKARLINTDDLQQRATNAPLHFSSQNNIATEITANDTTAHTDLQPANLENLAKITTQSSKEPVVRQTPENRVTIVKKEALPMAVVTQQQQQQLAHQSQQQAAAFNTSTESEEGGGEDDKTKKNHECIQCGKLFRRRDVMVRHERTHTNDFCYFCSCCGRGFMRRYVLLKHLKRDHNSEDLTKILSTKVSKMPNSPDVYIGYGSEVTLHLENISTESDVFKYLRNINALDDIPFDMAEEKDDFIDRKPADKTSEPTSPSELKPIENLPPSEPVVAMQQGSPNASMNEEQRRNIDFTKHTSPTKRLNQRPVAIVERATMHDMKQENDQQRSIVQILAAVSGNSATVAAHPAQPLEPEEEYSKEDEFDEEFDQMKRSQQIAEQQVPAEGIFIVQMEHDGGGAAAGGRHEQ